MNRRQKVSDIGDVDRPVLSTPNPSGFTRNHLEVGTVPTVEIHRYIP